MMVWAEVIGDPIAHSKSPAIHGFWLRALGLDGEYKATRVYTGGLAGYFSARRADPAWRGCSVTAPHKLAVIPFLDRVSVAAGRTGAVNCIHWENGVLIGRNTDLDGIGEALSEADIEGRKVVLIGAGGAARGALIHLSHAGASEIVILAREPKKAAQLVAFAKNVRALSFAMAVEAIAGASVIVNASPLGSDQKVAMPETILAALGQVAPGATAFDMIYQPLDTLFLQAARAHGLRSVDGLSMLIGQARRAFHLFFGSPAPRGRDKELRRAIAR